jgi:hypothetical protein
MYLYRRSLSSGCTQTEGALSCQLDHVHERRTSRRPARSAFQRRLKFPDQRIARPAHVFKHLQPAIATIQALRDRCGWLRWPAVPFIRIDHASASARSAPRMACLARSRAPSARIFVPDIREPKRTSRDLVLMAVLQRNSVQCH